MASQQSERRDIVAQTLASILQDYPAAVTEGVKWSTLVGKYERTSTKLDLSELGFDSAQAASSELLGDVARIVDDSNKDNPILAIKDEIVLKEGAALRASNWPLLYKVLSRLARDGKTNKLSQVTRHLQQLWPKTFEGEEGECEQDNSKRKKKRRTKIRIRFAYCIEECSAEEQSENKEVIRVKRLVEIVLSWREKWLARQISKRSLALGSFGMDAALYDDLKLIYSEEHNDFIVQNQNAKEGRKPVVANSSIGRAREQPHAESSPNDDWNLTPGKKNHPSLSSQTPCKEIYPSRSNQLPTESTRPRSRTLPTTPGNVPHQPPAAFEFFLCVTTSQVGSMCIGTSCAQPREGFFDDQFEPPIPDPF